MEFLGLKKIIVMHLLTFRYCFNMQLLMTKQGHIALK